MRTEVRERRKRVKPFRPLIVVGDLGSLADGMDELGRLMRAKQEYQQCNIILRQGCRNKPCHLSLGLFEWAETADGEMLNCLL